MKTKVIDYGMNGEGVLKVDGKVILVQNALMDEQIEYHITKDNGNYALAELDNIICKSPLRETPPCPYYNQCGGCKLQHMNYLEQLRFKQNHIKKTIKKVTGLTVDVNNTVPCIHNFHYRNKMSFSVNKFKVGLKKENSNDIVDIDYCMLANSKINDVLVLFKQYIKENNLDHIKNLVVRIIDNQILIGVVTTKFVDLKNLFSTFDAHFNNIGLYEILNTRNDSVVLCGKVIHIGGIKHIKINNFGLTYFVDLLGFHQTNLEIQNQLYENVLNLIDENSIIINGFSGQGLLTAILSSKAKSVTGIEINKSSHISAEKLKQTNNIKNMKNICGDFYKHISSELKNANTIILDPTKKGCGKDVMNMINGIQNIIYISCNPIALCKDINVLKNNYKITHITPFDMFPNTINVETLVKLEKI